MSLENHSVTLVASLDLVLQSPKGKQRDNSATLERDIRDRIRCLRRHSWRIRCQDKGQRIDGSPSWLAGEDVASLRNLHQLAVSDHLFVYATVFVCGLRVAKLGAFVWTRNHDSRTLDFLALAR